MDEVNKVIARTNKGPAKEELAALEKANDMLMHKKWIKDGEWSVKEI